MHESLQTFYRWFWICSSASVLYAVIAFVMIRRKGFYRRILDGGESFLMRLGFSKRVAGFGRGFSESRFCSVGMVVFAVLFLLLAAVHATGFLYFRHRLDQQSQDEGAPGGAGNWHPPLQCDTIMKLEPVAKKRRHGLQASV